MASESDIVVKTTYRNKTRDAVSSPVKSEAVATIETSVLEEVYLNNESNGTAHESKQALDDEAQVNLIATDNFKISRFAAFNFWSRTSSWTQAQITYDRRVWR